MRVRFPPSPRKKDMTEHKWEIEEVNGGHLGIDDFWKCNQCGASGGPVTRFKTASENKMVAVETDKPFLNPFFADGSGLELTHNCDESKKLIAAYQLGLERGKRLNPSREKLIRSIKKEALKFVKSWRSDE